MLYVVIFPGSKGTLWFIEFTFRNYLEGAAFGDTAANQFINSLRLFNVDSAFRFLHIKLHSTLILFTNPINTYLIFSIFIILLCTWLQCTWSFFLHGALELALLIKVFSFGYSINNFYFIFLLCYSSLCNFHTTWGLDEFEVWTCWGQGSFGWHINWQSLHHIVDWSWLQFT